MRMNLSHLIGNQIGTAEVRLAPETTLDGEPIGTELEDPEALPASEPQGDVPGVPGDEGQPPASFHEWKDPTGKVHSFASADELNQAMTSSFFRQSDYSKKTEGLKGRESQISAREQALEKQASELKEIEKKYGSFRNFMNQRPELFQQFSQMLQQPGTPGEAMSAAQNAVQPMLDEIKQELDDIKQWREGLNADKQRGSIHEKLSGELGEEYSAEAVDEFFSALNADDPESLYRFAHHALRGQQDPILAQKRAAEQNDANQRHKGVLPGRGKASTPKVPQSIEDGREAALADA